MTKIQLLIHQEIPGIVWEAHSCWEAVGNNFVLEHESHFRNDFSINFDYWYWKRQRFEPNLAHQLNSRTITLNFELIRLPIFSSDPPLKQIDIIDPLMMILHSRKQLQPSLMQQFIQIIMMLYLMQEGQQPCWSHFNNWSISESQQPHIFNWNVSGFVYLLLEVVSCESRMMQLW